jgi:hypothetical protein
MSTNIISVAQVRSTCGLAKTVDDRKLQPFLTLAQEELEKVLGRTLYDELETAIEADPTLATEPDLLTLVSYITGPLAWRTLQYSLPRLYAEPTANGVHSVNGGDYQSVDSRTLSMQVTQARSAADGGYERLLKFMDENTATYPSYNDNVELEERVSKMYPGGVITRKSRWQYPYGIRTPDQTNRNLNQYGECCNEH